MKPEKKQIWLLTLPAIVLFFALPLKAQVTVGKDSVPHSFSILELATDIERGGLRLPQFTTGGRESNLTPQLTDSLAEGLTIFNSEANCLEFWNGIRWVSLCDNTTTTTTVTTLAQPGSITGATDVCPSGTQTYSVGAVTGATSYVWTLPDGWTSATGTTTTTPSITVTPDLPSSITLNTSLSQLVVGGTVSVTANGASGAVSPASVLSVTTYNGCCAYISATEWKVFDCYNVGANQAANPLIPSADLNGDYYQWGSSTPAAYGPANGDAINGTWSSSTASATYYGDNTNATDITAKSLTDPCPDGYRVPSSDEWNGMITYNTKTNPGTWITNNWSGSMFGRALLLPAAGYRIAADGSLGNRGINGYYWSNRVNDSTSDYLLNFASGFANVTLGNYTRANGLSVRCIAE